MSRNKPKRRQPIPNPQSNPPAGMFQQFALGYDPSGKMDPVDIVGSKDGWSEYTISDGSVIRLKAALLDVKKAVGQYSADGNPIYVMQMVFVNQVKAPDKLRKKS